MTTTMEQQFRSLKSKHPDALLLFRCGDFYETYHEDAENAAKTLGITLTKSGDVRMAGFPHHALDAYLPKLIRAGFRIAICDQLDGSWHPAVSKPHMVELPKLTKKQYELLCECIRYRAADNDKERFDAAMHNRETPYFDELDGQLTELKKLLYNIV